MTIMRGCKQSYAGEGETDQERRCAMPDELRKEKEEEYGRWQGFANALLLALTVLFAGTTIALPEEVKPLSILSILCGLAGIVLTVLWFALEDSHKIRGRPAFLWLAACAFGLQAGFLFAVLLVGYL
jgi:hypothetical protein